VRAALVRADAAVPLRAGPTEGAAVRAMAEPGVVGRLQTCRGDWCELGAGGTSGWVPRAALWGVAPDEELD
jgi:SH3-like domain-containing protein